MARGRKARAPKCCQARIGEDEAAAQSARCTGFCTKAKALQGIAAEQIDHDKIGIEIFERHLGAQLEKLEAFEEIGAARAFRIDQITFAIEPTSSRS